MDNEPAIHGLQNKKTVCQIKVTVLHKLTTHINTVKNDPHGPYFSFYQYFL